MAQNSDHSGGKPPVTDTNSWGSATRRWLEGFFKWLKNVAGIGGSDGQNIVFSEQFSDDDSDLLDAYQAVSAGDTIVHQGFRYIKTTDGLERVDGHCIINSSFENLDGSGNFEFWTLVA